MPELFEKTVINGMELKNRLVRSATYENMADADGFPIRDLFYLYSRLTRGGVGLIITGMAFVSPDGKISPAGMLGIDRDEHIPAYQELTKMVHEQGTGIAMQIAHCGRQVMVYDKAHPPLAPSAVRDKSTFIKPLEMHENDISRIIEAFGQAARRVKASGFDAVQLHAAHGYLISQFLCPHTNRRKDKWGGSLENRMRFLKEIYHRCREEVGPDYPILVKISTYDYMKNGIKLEEGIEMCRILADLGIDGIEVSCGILEDGISVLRGDFPIAAVVDDIDLNLKGWQKKLMRSFGPWFFKPVPYRPAYNLEAARMVKQAVAVPVFVVGGITEPALMKDIIASEDVDYISLCRSLILDPFFPEKIAMGSQQSSKCIHCNLCIIYTQLGPLRCYHGKRVKSSVKMLKLK